MERESNSNVIMALCGGLLRKNGMQPLDAAEYDRLARRLFAAGMSPGDLIAADRGVYDLLGLDENWERRIAALLSRLDALCFEYERLARRGIFPVTRADSGYPRRIKERLKAAAPPYFFYSGNLSLANAEGIAVTGSRRLDAAGSDFAVEAAVKLVKEGLVLFSGGAEGTDTVTETAAAKLSGRNVSVLTGGLAEKLLRRDFADRAAEGSLLLLSYLEPEIPYSAELAPKRNKYLYAAGRAAFVVSSDYNKGCAWEGAAECIDSRWAPVFVRDTESPRGNSALIRRGGYAVDDLSRYPYSGWLERYEQEEPHGQASLFGLI